MPFIVQFNWSGYWHRGEVTIECAEDGEWSFDDLEYTANPKDGKWVDVSYLLDTPAAEFIYKAAEDFLWDAYDKYAAEQFEEDK